MWSFFLRGRLRRAAAVLPAALFLSPACLRREAHAPRDAGTHLETGTWAPLFELAEHEGRIVRVRFAPLANSIVSLSEDGYESSTLGFWHAATGELLASYTNRRHADGDVVFSPDGASIGIGGSTVFLLDADTRRTRAAFEAETYEYLKTIDVESSLFRPFSIRTYRIEHRHRSVTALSFSPDGRYLASGHENGQLKVWEVATGTLLNVLWGTKVFGPFLDVEFNPDGRFIAACQDDRRVRVWRFPDYRGKVLSARDRSVHAQGVRSRLGASRRRCGSVSVPGARPKGSDRPGRSINKG